MYHEWQMRRGFSIVLMLVFGFMPLSPLINGSEDVNLPACCRRNGTHHCSMRMAAMRAMVAHETAPTFAAPLTCPYYPGAATAFFTPPPALTASTASVSVAAEQPYGAPAAPAAPASTPGRSHSGRGPPNEDLS
ncbi:MAG: hypothetical protein WAV06_03580 [Terracidiphilus sp.]